MPKLMVRVLVAALLVVTGCSVTTPKAEDPPERTDEPVVTDVSAHRFVQDLWVYERLVTVDADGDQVDLTDAAVDGLQGPADREVELVDGVTFGVHDALDAAVTDAGGTVREDLDVVAGLIEYDGDRALAVLATPHVEAATPVGFGDQVSIDLTYLGDRLGPGDPLLADFAFLQAHPGDDDADASGLELLATRMAAERVGFFGQVDDDGTEVLLYSDQAGEAVEGSTRGRLPAKSNAMTSGMTKGLKGCKGGLRCVAKFFEKFGEGATDSWNQALDNGGMGPPTAPSRHPVCRGTYCGRSWGEPHLTTFDGVDYDMQAVGEFVAVSSPDLQVQLRTRPFRNLDTISIGTAVAVGYDTHRVTVDREADPAEMVRMNGDPVPLGDLRAEARSLDGATVSVVGDTVQIERGDDLITIANLEGREFLDLYVDFTAQTVDTGGLLGSADGDRGNDFTTRDGAVLDQPLSHDDLYDEFVESWRISDDESLFDYADGTDTEFFTDRSLPVGPVSADDLDDGDRARAEAVCRSAGIDDDGVLEACILDYGLTGDIAFVGSASVAEVAQLIADGILDAAAMPIGGSASGTAGSGVDAELSVAPYEPGPDEIVWLFDDEGTPDRVPDGLEVTAIGNLNDLGIFEFSDQYGYPTDPIMRVGPLEGATTPEDAIELGSYVEFEVVPTDGPVAITDVQLAVGRGRSGDTRRGIDLRSSADGYATSLLATDIEEVRPDMERFSSRVDGPRITGATTFRLFIYTGDPGHTVEFGDLALGTAR